MAKVDPTLEMEEALWKQGFFNIAGVDEAGRGAWAGPVSAGAVILPKDSSVLERLAGARDSKMMTPAERDKLYEVIRQESLCWCVAEASSAEIDSIGILNATKLAMGRAIRGLRITPDHLLIDYVRLSDVRTKQTSIKHGDAVSLSIACASIMAKVTRDRWMSGTADLFYPQYGFAQHKGYGTKQHQDAIEQFGPCDIHRLSFKPFAKELTLF